jgi:hypothetical protein
MNVISLVTSYLSQETANDEREFSGCSLPFRGFHSQEVPTIPVSRDTPYDRYSEKKHE